MTPLIVGLRDKYRVLALDLPGFGGSSPPPAPWGTPEYAAFVERAMTSLGVTRATYIGHSFGGRIAIWLAAHVPEAVQALVLVDAAGIRPRATFGRRTRQLFYKVAKTVLRLPILGARGPALQERLAMRFWKCRLQGDDRCDEGIHGKDRQSRPYGMSGGRQRPDAAPVGGEGCRNAYC